MKLSWWKIVTMALLLYVVIGGLLIEVPRKPILNETIRNLYFHVPMWFGMITFSAISVYHSIKYLSGFDIKNDAKTASYIDTTIIYGILGLITGMIWAKYTWGSFWSNDVKQNMATIALLIYCAQVVLRSSFNDEHQRAKISAIYNVFSFPLLIVLLFILPRMSSASLHPGNGGNPGFNMYDLDGKMRLIFYPAVIAWTMLGIWITTISIRTKLVAEKLENE